MLPDSWQKPRIAFWAFLLGEKALLVDISWTVTHLKKIGISLKILEFPFKYLSTKLNEHENTKDVLL